MKTIITILATAILFASCSGTSTSTTSRVDTTKKVDTTHMATSAKLDTVKH